jgi:hypothetical protein
MSVFSMRLAVLLVVIALLGLASCSGTATVSAARTKTPDFFWAAARETYAAGDYQKTVDHLEQLIEGQNQYASRAIPWYLMLTSGMAAGYIELSDHYAAGARTNKAHALAFRRKATEAANAGSRLALQFAQNVDKMEQVPAGSILLDFSLPRGTQASSPLLGQIAAGLQLAPADAEMAQTLAIERNVLLSACLTAGAPHDSARTGAILSRGASIPRVTFGKALAKMLDTESVLYSRDKLDDPVKRAAFKQRAQNVLDNAETFGTARVMKAQMTVR